MCSHQIVIIIESCSKAVSTLRKHFNSNFNSKFSKIIHYCSVDGTYSTRCVLAMIQDDQWLICSNCLGDWTNGEHTCIGLQAIRLQNFTIHSYCHTQAPIAYWIMSMPLLGKCVCVCIVSWVYRNRNIRCIRFDTHWYLNAIALALPEFRTQAEASRFLCEKPTHSLSQ